MIPTELQTTTEGATPDVLAPSDTHRDAGDDAGATNIAEQPVDLTPGLSLIRLRRKFFFATVILYMPLMWAVSKVSSTFRSMAFAFGIWVAILFITALYAALARCPRCNHYFHMNGMSLLFLRRCLHCQLHVTADRHTN